MAVSVLFIEDHHPTNFLLSFNKPAGIGSASLHSILIGLAGSPESDKTKMDDDEILPSELKKVEKRMLLAQKISERIKANGWRKIDFARALNKRPSEVTKWLSGTHNFNSDTLFDIEEILGIELITTESIFTQRTPTNN